MNTCKPQTHMYMCLNASAITESQMCSYIGVCVYVDMYYWIILGWFFTLSMPIWRLFIPFLQAKPFLFLFFLQRSSENDFIWVTVFLILCRARSTLTYHSTKARRPGHPVLVVLLLTPVYQIIEGQAAFLRMCLLSLTIILSRHRADTVIQTKLNRHYWSPESGFFRIGPFVCVTKYEGDLRIIIWNFLKLQLLETKARN